MLAVYLGLGLVLCVWYGWSSYARPSPKVQAILGGLFALVGTVCLTLACRAASDGHFLYSLDDSYIHLQLARNIASGHYGLNAGEVSAPSSSLLWPILLATFAKQPFFHLVPLILNVLFSTVSGAVVALVWTEILKARSPWLPLLASGTILVSNGIAVALTGMEHSLQLLLTNLVFYGLLQTITKSRVPVFLVFALVLSPLVRYENLALTIVTCIWLWIQGSRREALIALLVPVFVLLTFSLWLHHLGLGWLPTSIAAKTNIDPISSFGMSHVSWLAAVLAIAVGSALTRGAADRSLIPIAIGITVLALFLRSPWLCFIGFLLIVTIACPKGRPKELLWIALSSSMAHALFGRTGWFGRYEIYLYSFGILSVGYASGWAWSALGTGRRKLQRTLISVVGVITITLVGSASIKVLALTPTASACIYRQQFQTMRFVRDFYHAPVAVNDIGLVSFEGGQYVLDLWGLASLEALRARVANPQSDWESILVTQHHIGLVAIYDDWIPNRPKRWQKIGSITLTVPLAAVAEPTVSFYATPEAHLDDLKAQWSQFVQTLPKGVIFSAEPERPKLATSKSRS